MSTKQSKKQNKQTKSETTANVKTEVVSNPVVSNPVVSNPVVNNSVVNNSSKNFFNLNNMKSSEHTSPSISMGKIKQFILNLVSSTNPETKGYFEKLNKYSSEINALKESFDPVFYKQFKSNKDAIINKYTQEVKLLTPLDVREGLKRIQDTLTKDTELLQSKLSKELTNLFVTKNTLESNIKSESTKYRDLLKDFNLKVNKFKETSVSNYPTLLSELSVYNEESRKITSMLKSKKEVDVSTVNEESLRSNLRNKTSQQLLSYLSELEKLQKSKKELEATRDSSLESLNNSLRECTTTLLNNQEFTQFNESKLALEKKAKSEEKELRSNRDKDSNVVKDNKDKYTRDVQDIRNRQNDEVLKLINSQPLELKNKLLTLKELSFAKKNLLVERVKIGKDYQYGLYYLIKFVTTELLKHIQEMTKEHEKVTQTKKIFLSDLENKTVYGLINTCHSLKEYDRFLQNQELLKNAKFSANDTVSQDATSKNSPTKSNGDLRFLGFIDRLSRELRKPENKQFTLKYSLKENLERLILEFSTKLVKLTIQKTFNNKHFDVKNNKKIFKWSLLREIVYQKLYDFCEDTSVVDDLVKRLDVEVSNSN